MLQFIVLIRLAWFEAKIKGLDSIRSRFLHVEVGFFGLNELKIIKYSYSIYIFISIFIVGIG